MAPALKVANSASTRPASPKSVSTNPFFHVMLANQILQEPKESKTIAFISRAITSIAKKEAQRAAITDFGDLERLVKKRVKSLAIKIAAARYSEQNLVSWEDLQQVALRGLFEDFEKNPSKWCDPLRSEARIIGLALRIAKNKMVDELREFVDERTHSLRKANLELQNRGLPLNAENLSSLVGHGVKESDVMLCIPQASLESPITSEMPSDVYEPSTELQRFVPSQTPRPTDMVIPEDPLLSMRQDLERALPKAGLTLREIVFLALYFGNPKVLDASKALRNLARQQKGRKNPIPDWQLTRIKITLDAYASFEARGIRKTKENPLGPSQTTLKEIGELFDITESRACQVLRGALAKFEKAIEADGGIIWRPAKVNI